jgi:plastocyanin
MNNEDIHESPNRQHHVRSILYIVGLFAIAAIVVAAVGLGVGGTKSSGGSTMAGMTMDSGAGNAAPVATGAVRIKNFGFSPATITVTAGSTVVWTNEDSIQHDITFVGGSIASNTLNHNDTFSHTFATAGTYHYICSIHPFMHGTVIVTRSGSQHATATQTAGSSAYGY